MRKILKEKSKIIFSFFCIVSIFLSFCHANAQVSDSSEKIKNFLGEIRINSDSSIDVQENILYDFGGQEKHGIFRFVPVKYKARGGNFNLRVSNIKITDENGTPYNFQTIYEGKNIKFQIGDASRLVSGKKNYVISYAVRRAVNYFPDHDELYWNFTGDQWQVPIENASVKVILPEADKEGLQNKCFEGVFGTTNECDASPNGNTIEYKTKAELNSGEGMTIVAGWSKVITKEPTAVQNILDIVRDNWTLFAPLLVFSIMFRLWRKYGRDPRGRGTIIAQYEAPDGLAPAEVGTMLDGSAGNKDVSSTIIDLAVRGYLKIKRAEGKGFLGTKNTEYTFIKLKNEDPERNFEKEIMKGVFDGDSEKNLSDLKNKFFKTLANVRSQLYENVTGKGYYAKNPNTVFGIWIAIAIIGAAIMSGVFGAIQGGWGIASGVVSGIIILVFGWSMPAVTAKGAELKENILGFKDFLSVTEKDRLKFHNAPEKNPQIFEKFLPYAMVLGVENEWAKQFEGIYNQQPNWYEDSSGRMFNALILSSIVSDFNSSAMTAMSSQPSSAAGGGSGFSGGGGGGGFGGGSW